MAAYTASVSTFTWNAVVLDAIGTVSLSSARPPLDVTQVGSANTYHLPGVATSVVSLDIYYNAGAGGNHTQLASDYLSATSRAFIVTVATGDTISGNGFLTGLDVVSSNQDIVRGSIQIQVSGPITINGTAAVSGSNET
jgi:hypothetical protein